MREEAGRCAVLWLPWEPTRRWDRGRHNRITWKHGPHYITAAIPDINCACVQSSCNVCRRVGAAS